MPKNLAIRKGEHLHQPRENQIAERVKGNPAVENAKLNAKNRSPVQRKILPAKKEKNPVPIKKKTVPRESVKSNFFSFPLFQTLKFLS